MGWGQIGGLLIIGGAVLAVPAAVLSGRLGPGDDPSLRAVVMLSLSASLALLGSGAGVLGVFGPRPFHGSGIRIGLGALGLGLLSFLFFMNVPIPAGHNDLSYGPSASSGIIGALASLLGLLVLGIGLLRATGLARAVGSLFVAALLLPVLAVPFNGDDGAGTAAAILVAPLLFVLGVLGIGILAIRAERIAPDASA